MWALCTEKCEHSPTAGLFCIHSPKAKVQPSCKIHNLWNLMWNMATLCDDGVTSSSTMTHPTVTDEHFVEGILMLVLKHSVTIKEVVTAQC